MSLYQALNRDLFASKPTTSSLDPEVLEIAKRYLKHLRKHQREFNFVTDNELVSEIILADTDATLDAAAEELIKAYYQMHPDQPELLLAKAAVPKLPVKPMLLATSDPDILPVGPVEPHDVVLLRHKKYPTFLAGFHHKSETPLFTYSAGLARIFIDPSTMLEIARQRIEGVTIFPASPPKIGNEFAIKSAADRKRC